MTYATLIGPLHGLYFPLPDGTEKQHRDMLNSSALKDLWCALYDEETVDQLMSVYGGIKLPVAQREHFMFSHAAVFGHIADVSI